MQSPDHFEFFSQPKIISGNKALEHIPIELSDLNAKKPLVLISNSKNSKSKNKTFIKAMADSQITIGAFYDNISDVAQIGEIRELADLYVARGCDAIIAIGDRSVVHTAKAVNIQVSGTKDYLEYDNESLNFKLKPLVVVMTETTVGRSTSSAVCVDHNTYSSTTLFPDLIVIDSKMLMNKNSEITIDTGMTALTQLVEAGSKTNNNPMNDTYIFSGTQLIYENLSKLVKKPQDKKAAVAVANGIAFAGIAFSNTSAKMTYILGSSLSIITNYKPAELMRIILPYSINYKSSNKKNSIRPELLLAIAGIDTYAKTPENQRAEKAISLLTEFIDSLSKGKAKSLNELKIPTYKLEEAAKMAVSKAKFDTSTEECYQILLNAWNGKLEREDK